MTGNVFNLNASLVCQARWENQEGKGAEGFLYVAEHFFKLAADSLKGSNKSSLSLAKKNIDEGVKAFISLLYRNLSVSSTDASRKDMESTEQHCSFWKTDLSGKSFWSTKGSRKVTGNSTVVTCKCNHLTNFALLVLAHMFIFIRSSRLFWHLGVSYCYLNTRSSDRVFPESLCPSIAVALHYVFLVLFFLMLAEGVSVFITVTLPFNKKSHITELLLVAFHTRNEKTPLLLGFSISVCGAAGFQITRYLRNVSNSRGNEEKSPTHGYEES